MNVKAAGHIALVIEGAVFKCGVCPHTKGWLNLRDLHPRGSNDRRTEIRQCCNLGRLGLGRMNLK